MKSIMKIEMYYIKRNIWIQNAPPAEMKYASCSWMVPIVPGGRCSPPAQAEFHSKRIHAGNILLDTLTQ